MKVFYTGQNNCLSILSEQVFEYFFGEREILFSLKQKWNLIDTLITFDIQVWNNVCI